MDHDRFRKLIRQLYSVVKELEQMFPGRHFTPDGHTVGSIGESIVAYAYDLQLAPASNPGFDATTADGRQVEIKATQAKRVAFRSCPEYAIVIRIKRDGDFDEFYNGPGSNIWAHFEGRRRPSNGQYQIGLPTLAKLGSAVDVADRIPRRQK